MRRALSIERVVVRLQRVAHFPVFTTYVILPIGRYVSFDAVDARRRSQASGESALRLARRYVGNVAQRIRNGNVSVLSFRELDKRIRSPIPDRELWAIEIVGVVYLIHHHHGVRVGSAQRHVAKDVLSLGHLVIVIDHVRRRQRLTRWIGARSQAIHFT